MNFLFALILMTKFDCDCKSECFETCIKDKYRICELEVYLNYYKCTDIVLKDATDKLKNNSSNDNLFEVFSNKLTVCKSDRIKVLEQCKSDYLETFQTCEDYYYKHGHNSEIVK